MASQSVLRIHFTSDDLARTRMATAADPLWETVLSLHQLQAPTTPLVFDAWWRRARSAHVRDSLRGQLDLLIGINPVAPYFPDFLTPPDGGRGLAAGIDAVLSTPKRRLRHELGLLAKVRSVPRWARRLADGDAETLDRLATALQTYYRTMVGPYVSRIQADIDTHRANCARALLDGGIERLVARLGPALRWKPPVLEADFPFAWDLRLDGRGLLLVPSYFCWRYPTLLADPTLPQVLVHPIDHTPPWLDTPDGEPGAGPGAALANLVGQTRAAVLETLATDHTTLTLARRVGIAPATATHHTTVLRNARLIATQRDGNTAVHSLTALGAALLNHTTPPNSDHRSKT